jgi:hypothetical protein
MYAPRLFDTMIENIIKESGSVIYHGDNKKYTFKSFIEKEYYRSYIFFNEKYKPVLMKYPHKITL